MLNRSPVRGALTASLLSIAAALPCIAAVRSEEPQTLRVLTYNIHHGEGIDGALDLERIARVIGDAKPDLVALQEVDVRAERTGKVDQAAELGRLTRMHVAFGAAMDFQGGQYGNAVLSRWPIRSQKVYPLPRVGESEPRAALVCVVDLPDREEDLTIAATHFDFRADPAERLASVAKIEEIATTLDDRPALLAGDLNDVPGSEPLKRLRESWTVANEKPLPTIPVGEPTRQIDFVLYRPAFRWRSVRAQVLEESVASDHRALLAELELLPAK